VTDALSNAVSGTVIEGAVGGGSSMLCHDLKGGISAKRLSSAQGGWTVGAIVHTHTHGIRNELRIDDYPVGRYEVQADSPLL
jgi:D-aminopeptidase